MKVAVVDSGINAHHSHVGGVVGGVHLTQDKQGRIVFGPDYRDFLGHGTAIAGVIRARAPDAELYSVKVFDGSLWTQAAVVAAAIRWCADSGLQVANVSLGAATDRERHQLQEACDYAARKGLILVAAGEDNGPELFPACFPKVIGVAADEGCDWDNYFYLEGKAVEFRAHGFPRPLPGRPQANNFRGHSFAAAHISGRVVRILGQQPRASYLEARQILIQDSTPLTGPA